MTASAIAMRRVAVVHGSTWSRTAGGPSGYLWHLREGVWETEGATYRAGLAIAFYSKGGTPGSNGRSTSLPHGSGAIHWMRSYGAYMVPRYSWMREADLRRSDLIHFHSTSDLARFGLAGKIPHRALVALTVHCPEAPAAELRYVAPNAPGWARRLAGWTDLWAVRRADAIVAPSAEALDPLMSWVPAADRVLATKRVVFAETGIVAGAPAKRDARNRSTGTRRPVMGFMGRHNEVKGYDLFCEAVRRAWASGSDIRVVVAGSLGGQGAPVDDRWCELGIVDPATFFERIDVLVLPNRATFFDLVLLEAMAAGVAVIASDTGGNRTVAARAPGVRLFSPVCAEALEDALVKCWAGDGHSRDGERNRRVYEEHYTHRHFAMRYLGALKAVLQNGSTASERLGTNGEGEIL